MTEKYPGPPPEFRAKTDERVRLINEAKERKRKERVPFGGSRLNLSVDPKAGKFRRWFKDIGDRCQRAEKGGYEFVVDDGLKVGDTNIGSGNQNLGSRVSRIVGTQDDGRPITAYLMEIDQDLYDEDQAEKQRKLDIVDDQIKHGGIRGEVGKDGRYIPKDGISYKP